MSQRNQDAPRRGLRVWSALGGFVLFGLVGLVLLPGLTRPERRGGPPAVPPAPAPAPAVGTEPVPPPPATASPAPGAESSAAGAAVASLDPDEIGFDCMIEPFEVVELGSPVTGRIEAIEVERSDYVEAGEVVARLESEVERAAVRVARERAARTADVEASRASLVLGRKRRARASELFEKDSLALDLREEAETEAKLAALRLEQALENRRLASLELDQARAILERRMVRSPISGYVLERMMAPGEVVDEERMLRIARVDPLRVEVLLPSAWFGRIAPGMRAEVFPEAPHDAPHAAEVERVDPVIDGASGTFGARLLLANPGHELPAGLRCQVRFLDVIAGDTAS